VPQLRYAGRLAGDPLNQLAQGEATLFPGAGSQTATSNRWGDYSDLTIDPVDDCTFWYTSEYYPAGSSQFNWRTRIGSFKFPSCGGPPPPPPPPPPAPPPPPPPPPGPVSQITGTGATCSQFSAGTATTLSTLTYTTRNGRIRSVSPGGFNYWVRLNASAGSNTAVISQAITTGNFSTLFGQGSGSTVSNSSCAAVSGATFTAGSGNGTFTVQWNAASAGTYFIGLRLSTSGLRNRTAPNPPTVHYSYSTSGVTGSTSGIDLSP
jgi:hypothetical protein